MNISLKPYKREGYKWLTRDNKDKTYTGARNKSKGMISEILLRCTQIFQNFSFVSLVCTTSLLLACTLLILIGMRLSCCYWCAPPLRAIDLKRFTTGSKMNVDYRD